MAIYPIPVPQRSGQGLVWSWVQKLIVKENPRRKLTENVNPRFLSGVVTLFYVSELLKRSSNNMITRGGYCERENVLMRELYER